MHLYFKFTFPQRNQGEAKFWMKPIISLALSHGLDPRRLKEIQKIIEEHENEIIKEWQKHFNKR